MKNTMNDEFGIQVNVAGSYYKLRCKRSEEIFYRKAAKQINDKILQYQRAYPESGFELKDLLSMVALQLSLETVSSDNQIDTSPVFDKMRELGAEIETRLVSDN